MPKTILIPEEEYAQEIQRTYAQAFTAGRKQMMDAVSLILEGKQNEVVISENAEDDLKAFIEKLKNDERIK